MIKISKSEAQQSVESGQHKIIARKLLEEKLEKNCKNVLTTNNYMIFEMYVIVKASDV